MEYVKAIEKGVVLIKDKKDTKIVIDENIILSASDLLYNWNSIMESLNILSSETDIKNILSKNDLSINLNINLLKNKLKEILQKYAVIVIFKKNNIDILDT